MTDGCPHDEEWFDRTVCACGSMHSYCVACGALMGPCDAALPAATESPDLSGLRALSEAATPGDLDAAWAEAEAALPKGWIVYGVNLTMGDGPWQAVAGVRERDDSGRPPFVAFGQHHDSPAAALRELARSLLAKEADRG